jgi:hypothetical protein
MEYVNHRAQNGPSLDSTLSALNPFHTVTLFLRLILILSCSLCLGPQAVSSFHAFWLKFLHFSSPHARYMSSSLHRPEYDHPDNIYWILQLMRLLIMQLRHSCVIVRSYLFVHFFFKLPYSSLGLMERGMRNLDKSGRSQWPRGLRHELSSPARALGSWVRIPLKECMCDCVSSVFVLSCVSSGLAMSWPPSKDSYWLSVRFRVSE